jgi:hypothetical protein
VTTYYLYYEDLKMAKALASTYTLIAGNPQSESSLTKTFFLSGITITAADYIELDVGFKPRKVCIQNVTDLILTDWNESLTKTVNSQSLVAGVKYKILTVGGVDYTLVGAPNSVVGTEFIANSTVGGTGGTCITSDDICIKTSALGAISLVTATPSIIAKDRSLIIAENATTAILLASKVYSIVVTG